MSVDFVMYCIAVAVGLFLIIGANYTIRIARSAREISKPPTMSKSVRDPYLRATNKEDHKRYYNRLIKR